MPGVEPRMVGSLKLLATVYNTPRKARPLALTSR